MQDDFIAVNLELCQEPANSCHCNDLYHNSTGCSYSFESNFATQKPESKAKVTIQSAYSKKTHAYSSEIQLSNQSHHLLFMISKNLGTWKQPCRTSLARISAFCRHSSGKKEAKHTSTAERSDRVQNRTTNCFKQEDNHVMNLHQHLQIIADP